LLPRRLGPFLSGNETWIAPPLANALTRMFQRHPVSAKADAIEKAAGIRALRRPGSKIDCLKNMPRPGAQS
jgi:hypothetical protein